MDIDHDERRRCFELLNDYAKSKHGCFLSEFFRRREDDIYLACFRPLGGSPSDPNRYACEYVEFDLRELKSLEPGTPLTSAIIERIDRALSRLLSKL
jgi:hypothetical protein